MFWLRNEKNNFLLRTLICGPVTLGQKMVWPHFNTLHNNLAANTQGHLKCIRQFYFAALFEGKVQNMEHVQKCTGFMLCTFSIVVHFKLLNLCIFQEMKVCLLLPKHCCS